MNPLSSFARFAAAGALIALACTASAPAMALPTYSTPDARQLGDKVLGTKAVTCASDGAGTHSPCTLLFQGVGNVSYTCSDTDGCDITMSEVGVYDGAVVRVTNVSANTVYFPNSAGVLQTAGSSTASVAQWGTFSMKYATDRWVETSRSGVPGTTVTLANAESISNAVNGTITLGRDDSGTVTVTAADDDATAALTVLPGGAAALTLGGATTTGITFKNDGTAATFNRATSGTFTIQATDDDANATIALRGGGTGAVIIGNASNTAITLTTDGTGDAEVVLPVGSVSAGEILDLTRSIPLPLAGWIDCTARTAISVSDGADTKPDFTLVNSALTIVYDITGGSIDTNEICTSFVVPADYVSGGSFNARLIKGGSVVTQTETFSCRISVDGAAVGAANAANTANQTAVQTVTSTPAGTWAAGSTIGVVCKQGNASADDSVTFLGIEGSYTASE